MKKETLWIMYNKFNSLDKNLKKKIYIALAATSIFAISLIIVGVFAFFKVAGLIFEQANTIPIAQMTQTLGVEGQGYVDSFVQSNCGITIKSLLSPQVWEQKTIYQNLQTVYTACINNTNLLNLNKGEMI